MSHASPLSVPLLLLFLCLKCSFPTGIFHVCLGASSSSCSSGRGAGEGVGGSGGWGVSLLPPPGLNLSCSFAFRASGYSIHHTAFEIVVCWHVSLSGCIS